MVARNTYPALEARLIKNTICLFDLDGTLTPEKQAISTDMLSLLRRLRHKCAIGYVSGGPFARHQRQLGTPRAPVTSFFDFCFAENGVTAYRMGTLLPGTSFIEWIGQVNYNAFVSWVIKYIADLDIPIKRGTFVEFRRGNVNISPIGQGASHAEMEEFQRYDEVHGIRRRMIDALEKEFSELDLKYAIGGQVCFDAFPIGWDKTYCLRHVEAEKYRSGLVFKHIHFFGDKTLIGGNDFEIYEDPRVLGHMVMGPEDTKKQVEELFDL